MQDFEPGQRVNHPKHGPCVVTFVGEEYIGVEFEGGSHALLKRESFVPKPDEGAGGAPEEEAPAEPLPWPTSTFVRERPDAKHFMGSHWEPFFDSADTVLKQLPQIAPRAQLWIGFADTYPAPRQAPGDWARGFALVWPAQRQGLILTVRVGGETNDIMSLFPFISDGTQHTLRLDRVTVWESGVEAQIEATWGDASITFFDAGFLVNRGWYEAGEDYDFILTGIAYSAKPATVIELPVTPHPDDLAWQRALAEKRGEPPLEPMTSLQLEGAALLIPIPEWDADDYEFRAPVKSVKEIAGDVLGQTGWIVRATVMRFDDRDADLDILITRRAWKGEAPPAVGKDIGGRLWLRGRLWYPKTWYRGEAGRR
jgi:hypothetical protein